MAFHAIDDPGQDRPSCVEASPDAMAANAAEAAAFLKSLAHEGRLMILCRLADGERSVSDLEDALGARQPAVSQQLARLRHEGLVEARREGRVVLYRLADDRVERIVRLLYDLFCGAPTGASKGGR
ncbi:metalloregulator ArsR/SmtB family transcription factor [Rubellimicrobium sp. CFH 75288]|uniref:ArsR/SmtB family transcription factor n=1 Tax=Rubellimicrobium sp. CFH 75288 TaxID=2697034 RepID=UPI001412714C|nr:metalloregulator ArsR/SmtB family transcription factor [Rubellimicrobium sp. CFH 75288]